MGVGFTFGPINLEIVVVVIDFESDEGYQSMRMSLTSCLKRSHSHREVVCWLEDSSGCCTHGLHFLFVDRFRDLLGT